MIYLDYSANTPVDPAVLDIYCKTELAYIANPNSTHCAGQAARAEMARVTESIASQLGVQPAEIIYTSGASEANNLALKGIAQVSRHIGKHIISTQLEHSSVGASLSVLQQQGYEIDLLNVNRDGKADLAQLRELLRKDTILVAVCAVDSEIGTVQPIAELAAIAHAHGAWFHTDAVQAVGHIPVDVKALGVDMLSLSGHKFHAPKGVGALYVKKGILPNIFMDGGAQEKGRRAGTENLASIVGLGEAITVATASLEENMARITAMRDRLIDSLLQLPRTRLNGSREHRLPGNLNISFEGIEGESLLLRLDMAGICASSGSACTSGSLDPSHVLMAIGLKHEVAHGSLRLSLSELTTEEDIDYIIAQVPPIVEGLRAMSPVWEKIKDL